MSKAERCQSEPERRLKGLHDNVIANEPQTVVGDEGVDAHDSGSYWTDMSGGLRWEFFVLYFGVMVTANANSCRSSYPQEVTSTSARLTRTT